MIEDEPFIEYDIFWCNMQFSLKILEVSMDA